MTKLEKLIKVVEGYQEAEGLSNVKLGAKIGIDHSHISLFKRGLRDPGRKFLQALMTLSPALRMAVIEYMSVDEMKGGKK